MSFKLLPIINIYVALYAIYYLCFNEEVVSEYLMSQKIYTKILSILKNR